VGDVVGEQSHQAEHHGEERGDRQGPPAGADDDERAPAPGVGDSHGDEPDGVVAGPPVHQAGLGDLLGQAGEITAACGGRRATGRGVRGHAVGVSFLADGPHPVGRCTPDAIL
jgi:hypothetical protein